MTYGLSILKTSGAEAFGPGEIMYFLKKRCRILISPGSYYRKSPSARTVTVPMVWVVFNDSNPLDGEFTNNREDTTDYPSLAFCDNQSELYVGLTKTWATGSLTIAQSRTVTLSVFGTATRAGYIDVYIFRPYLPKFHGDCGLAIYDSNGVLEYSLDYAPLMVKSVHTASEKHTYTIRSDIMYSENPTFMDRVYNGQFPNSLAWNYPGHADYSRDNGYSGKDDTAINICWRQDSTSLLRYRLMFSSEDREGTYTVGLRNMTLIGIDAALYRGLEDVYQEVS